MNKKGFTFIEVIIIFTIVFIMTAVLLSTSYKDRTKKEVEAAAREVSASIRETQNNALTGKQKANDTLPCTFRINFSSNGYQMMHKARGIDDKCLGGFDAFFNKVELPKDITIEAFAVDANNLESDVNHIMFRVPYGDFMINNDKTYKGVEVIVKKGDEKKYRICIHSTGMVEELGFNDATGLVCVF